MNRNTVMATDGVTKKPSRVFLYECAFVISCDEFIVMPVSTKDAFHISHVISDTQLAPILMLLNV